MVGEMCLRLLKSSTDSLEQAFLFGWAVSVWYSDRAESLLRAFRESWALPHIGKSSR